MLGSRWLIIAHPRPHVLYYSQKERGGVMELRTLRYYLAVASERNITRAADLLHVTQPTLSRQMGDLERELGVTLFLRGKRNLTLTEEGMLFRQRAQDIVELADRAQQEFSQGRGAVGGTIALGVSESLGAGVLAQFVRGFSRQYPQVRFTLLNGMADDLRESLDQGSIDLALVLEPVDTTRYEFLRLSTKERWGVLVHQSHPFAGRQQVDAGELAEEPLMLPSRESSRREILHWMGLEEDKAHIVVNYNILSNTVLLVEEGMGAAVCLNGALAIHHSPSLRFVPFIPEHSIRSVLIWKRGHVFNPATSLFVQQLRQSLERV